jgi:hypothetical protein
METSGSRWPHFPRSTYNAVKQKEVVWDGALAPPRGEVVFPWSGSNNSIAASTWAKAVGSGAVRAQVKRSRSKVDNIGEALQTGAAKRTGR